VEGGAAALDFAALAGLLQDALLLVSEGGTIVALNAAAARLMGRGPEALRGQPFASFARDSSEAGRMLRTALRSRSFSPGAVTIMTPSEPLACRCDGALYRPRTGPAHALAVFRLSPRQKSATEFVALRQKIVQLTRENLARRQAEEALAHANESYPVTPQSIGDAVMVADPEGRIGFMNAVAEQLTGWTTQEAAGRLLDEVFVIVNEHSRAAVESPVAKVLRLGTVVGLANHTLLLRRDGTEIPIDDSGAPIRGANGRIEGVVLVFRDLSERHALERELLAKTQRLEEADRRKNEYLSMLAHELRNPLAPLRNGVELLRRQQQDPAVSRTVEIMGRQIAHMVRLLDDLLDMSRLSKGTIELRWGPVSLPELLRAAEEMMLPVCTGLGVALAVRVPPARTFSGDFTRLVQVLGNLIGNAAKFSPRGSTVEVSAAVQQDSLDIVVRDAGIGMQPEHLPRVFDLFFQAEPGISRERGGLGVGLTISRYIVELHGGSIRAHSEGPGTGSTFTVSLPA
jgi:PAS domain S-box-containing protein